MEHRVIHLDLGLQHGLRHFIPVTKSHPGYCSKFKDMSFAFLKASYEILFGKVIPGLVHDQGQPCQ